MHGKVWSLGQRKPARDLEMVWHPIFNARPPVINPLLDCNINVVFRGRETDIWGDHIVWEQRENKSLPTEYQDRGVTIKHWLRNHNNTTIPQGGLDKFIVTWQKSSVPPLPSSAINDDRSLNSGYLFAKSDFSVTILGWTNHFIPQFFCQCGHEMYHSAASTFSHSIVDNYFLWK